jgi:hypothetical protein
MAERFGGVTIKGDQIGHKDGAGPIAGARATVDTAGEIEKRYTATRFLLAGPFALAFKKKKDKRELYLMVEGEGFAFVEQVDPKKGADARKFAARINTLSSQAQTRRPAPAPAAPWPPIRATAPPPPPSPAPPPPPSIPAGWMNDPTERHDLRYWDGSRWTEHVSTGGVQSTDQPGPAQGLS